MSGPSSTPSSRPACGQSRKAATTCEPGSPFPERFRLAFAPFSLFDRLFLDRVILVEADEGLDVVAGGDAFLGTEAGKIAARLELGQGALGEVKADQQVEKRVEGD